tara:strand:+ start:227 stop:709 length:483 start_codon:yes stop_codon:yes gene_type:complete
MSAKDNTRYNLSSFEVIGDTSNVVFPKPPVNTPGENPIYPLYNSDDDYSSLIDSPNRFMLHDMDDPLNMCFFMKKFPDHGITFSKLSIHEEFDDIPWVSPRISVDKFNKWTDEMKLYWMRNYQPEIHIVSKDPVYPKLNRIHAAYGLYEEHVISLDKILS